MKRTRFDSEYDKIRRSAGLAKPAYEFPDAREEQQTQERVEAMNADFRARMADLSETERATAAAKSAEFNAWSRDYHLRVIKREFTRRGIAPPEPLVSLSLLLQIGWTLQHITDDRYALLRPMWSQEPKRETRPAEMGS